MQEPLQHYWGSRQLELDHTPSISKTRLGPLPAPLPPPPPGTKAVAAALSAAALLLPSPWCGGACASLWPVWVCWGLSAWAGPLLIRRGRAGRALGPTIRSAGAGAALWSLQGARKGGHETAKVGWERLGGSRRGAGGCGRDALLAGGLSRPIGTTAESGPQMQRLGCMSLRSGPAIAHSSNQTALWEERASQRRRWPAPELPHRPSIARAPPAPRDPAPKSCHQIGRSSAGPFQPRSRLEQSGALRLCSGASYRQPQRCCWRWRPCCRRPAAMSLTWCAAALLPPAGELPGRPQQLLPCMLSDA